MSRRVLACVACGVVVFLIAGVGAVARAGAVPSQGSAQGAQRIVSYDSDATIRRDGSLLVRERIVYDFGAARRHGIFRLIRVRVDYPPQPNHDRVYRLHVQSVRGSPGTPTQLAVEG